MLDSSSRPVKYSAEQAFLDSFKAYVNSPDCKGFDRQAYDDVIKGYSLDIRNIWDRFFDAIEQFAKTKDVIAFQISLKDYLKHQYGGSDSPYSFTIYANQTAFGNFILKENLKSFLKEIEEFVGAGNSLEAVDWTGYSGEKPLGEAFISALENYLKNKVIDQKLLDSYKGVGALSVLGWAALYQQVQFAGFLLDKGYDFYTNYFDNGGCAPLTLAAQSPDPKVLIEFLKRGANPHYADSPWSLIANAASSATNSDGINFLIEKGVKPDECGSSGETALIKAAWTNANIDVIENLINKGADVNYSKCGYTVPFYNATSGRLGVPVMELFLARGADPKYNNRGFTALMEATQSGDMPTRVKFILDLKVIDINSVERYEGKTATIICVNSYFVDQVMKTLEILVEAKADLNIRDNDGKTALDYAVERKLLDVEKYLRDNGAKRGAELQTYTQAATSYLYSGLSRLMNVVSSSNDNKPQHNASTAVVNVDPNLHPHITPHRHHNRHFGRTNMHEQDAGLGK
jgi:uncharacterized protein